MLTPFDDYPIHQTVMPVAHPTSGDRNHYDRAWFNGYDADEGWYFGIAMGIYPNRGVIDAAFSVARDGVQRSVFASGRAPDDRARTTVGPIALDVLEPLRTSRVRVAAAHLGIAADLTWEARTAALEEPRQTITAGSLVVMDSTRLVQWGRWRGTITVDGARIDVDAFGTKDRSWGIRPVGEPQGGAPPTGLAGGGLFFLWAPVNFERSCTHLVRFEHPDGTAWYERAAEVPVLEPGEPAWGNDERVRHARGVTYAIDWVPGTRRAARATLDYDWRDGARESLTFEPVMRFVMKGLGYWHPAWSHGVWRGEAVEGSDEWKIDEQDPLDPSHIHVQQLCRVTRGDERGVGILEQIVMGPHAPTGFRDFLDGAGARPV